MDNPADRRRAPRLKAEDVPWIVTVRLGNGDAARLVDISRTGLLLETTERLRPGQRGTMTLGLAGSKTAHVSSHIVRSNLVAISRDVPVYQAAFLFAKELELQLLEPGPTEAEQAKTSSGLWSQRLDGPFDALWATDSRSDLVRVTSLSEIGCVAHAPIPIETGTLAAVTIIFAPVRRLLLTCRVVDQRSDGGNVVRFEGLSADQRRALRVELTSQTPSTAAPLSGYRSLLSLESQSGGTWLYTAGLQASDW